MTAVIYTQENCSMCEMAKEVFPGAEVRSGEDMVAGVRRDPFDVDALAQLCIQNQSMPVVFDGKRFIEPREVAAMALGV